MAYFSGCAELEEYQQKWCVKCVHGQAQVMCPVMELQMAWNFQAVGAEADEAKRYALDQCGPGAISQLLAAGLYFDPSAGQFCQQGGSRSCGRDHSSPQSSSAPLTVLTLTIPAFTGSSVGVLSTSTVSARTNYPAKKRYRKRGMYHVYLEGLTIIEHLHITAYLWVMALVHHVEIAVERIRR